MKKFHFKLEGILKLRREAERQCEMEVQRIQALIQGIYTRMNQISLEQDIWRKSYNEAGSNHAWLFLIENYLVTLEQESVYQERNLQGLQDESQLAQEKLKEAYKARRQVEHLKEKQHHEYLQKMNKLMEKEMSEMTILRFAHRQLEMESALASSEVSGGNIA
ncbi:MAG: flagellar export protein FliJ [Deltaproteobacteria bacterium]|nr:MAG: flagellar export protein FliJ [Deltaproteobacteria bacterium]